MQIRKAIINAAVGAMIFLPVAVSAQSSSINTFSPYTFYGIGDLSTQGPQSLRSMGGAGVAFRNPIGTSAPVVNNLNPASFSAAYPRSFIFNFELEGENYYLSQNDPATNLKKKSSYNTFNIRDISLMFPIVGNKLGFGFTVTPYSSLGYRLERQYDDDEIISTGILTSKWEGSGDITQLKAGLGWNVAKGLSIGAEMVYYKGYLDRERSMVFEVLDGDTGYNTTSGSTSEDISRIFLNAGFQYNAIADNRRMLTIGGAYRMGGKLNPKMQTYIPSNNIYSDTVFISNTTGDFYMANQYTFGASFQTPKFVAVLDYSYADWGSKNKKMAKDGMQYVDTHSIKGGVSYTPARYDIRNYLNRLTYRVGFRYEDYYMKFNNTKLSDKVVTLGVGIPMKYEGFSNINVGVELGQRGKLTNGLVKANYFKVSIGLSLFGEDYWFIKQKYN